MGGSVRTTVEGSVRTSVIVELGEYGDDDEYESKDEFVTSGGSVRTALIGFESTFL